MSKFIIEAKDMNGQTFFLGGFEAKQEAVEVLNQNRRWLATSEMVKVTDQGEDKFRAKNTKYGDWAEYYIKEK